MRPYYFQKDEKIIDKVRNKDRWNIFIGDVHNCGIELLALLNKVGDYLDKIGCSRTEKVNVWFLGDLIHKGRSDNLSIILNNTSKGNNRYNGYDFTYDCILGNHEDNHIAWKQGLRTEYTDGYQETEDVLKGFGIDLQYEAFPVTIDFLYPNKIITIGHAYSSSSSGTDNVLFYNQLSKRDLLYYLRLRYEDLRGELVRLGKENPKQDIFWAQNYCNENEKPGHQEVVLFGHQCSYDSANGGPKYPLIYNNEDTSTLCIGLDTGCVHGGALSALVVSPKGDMHLVQVPSRMVYEAPKPIMKMVPNRHLGNYHLDSRLHDVVISDVVIVS